MMYEGGIDAFREKQRQEAIARHERNKQQDREQQERIAAEKEAAKLPFHDEMKSLCRKTADDLRELQPGDIRAMQKTRTALLTAFNILQYLLAALDTMPTEGQQERTGGAETG